MINDKIVESIESLDGYRAKIKNLILDFGGVLFDVDYRLPIAAFSKLGLSNFQEYYKKSSQIELFDQLEKGLISNQSFVEVLALEIKNEVEHVEIVNAWNSILIDISKDKIEKVIALKEKYKTYLLSNTNAIHVEAFEKKVDERMGLEYFKSAFHNIYYSNDIKIKKPDPETFLQVCRWNNMVPEETLFIDDSIQHVEGAAKAGLYAFHLKLEQHDFLQVFKSW